jgi:hypothetical protein
VVVLVCRRQEVVLDRGDGEHAQGDTGLRRALRAGHGRRGHRGRRRRGHLRRGLRHRGPARHALDRLRRQVSVRC